MIAAAWWFEFWRTMMVMPFRRSPRSTLEITKEIDNVVYVRAAVHRSSS